MSSNIVPKFEGTHYEMGKQQGKYYKQNIHLGVQTIQKRPEFLIMKPSFIPKFLFWKMARRKAVNWLKPYYEIHAPNQAQRVKGISEGANLSEDWIYLLMSTELVLDTPDYEVPLESCTDIGISLFRSSENTSIIGRNFDYFSFVLPFLKARNSCPSGNHYSSIDITVTPYPGNFNGMNENGLFIGVNELATIESRKNGLPASILIQEALENCKTTKEAIELIKSKPRGSTNAMIIGDSKDDVKIVEYTYDKLLTRKPNEKPDGGWIVQTNHYIQPEFQKIEIPLNALFGKKAPNIRQGVAIGKSSLERYKIATKYLSNFGEQKISTDMIKSILTDHSGDPDDRYASLCRHDPLTMSAASFIAKPQNRELYYCIGTPCNREYIKFKF